MSDQKQDNKQGHWTLAKVGKKVLRPGGKELTLQMLDNLNISSTDDVVEFAPGLGYTAGITLKKNPKSYTAIELSEDATAYLRKNVIKGENRSVIIANARESTLSEESADKVYGEAMLTMQSDSDKAQIIGEAARILKKGGLYGIHEIALVPDEIEEEQIRDIQKDLAQAIKVNARPLTKKAWISMLEDKGFEVEKVLSNPMHLLELKRVISDEGLFRTLKIFFNVLTKPQARKRILEMRGVFRKHGSNMHSISIIARKK
ncbi:MAG: SAM-dependent methyltransferase [Planctomycetota bacterium]|nr:MAG: SAM-dependent methyltransferase [Planctomycetota bacterium]